VKAKILTVSVLGAISLFAVIALVLSLTTQAPVAMAQNSNRPLTAYTIFSGQRLEDETVYSVSPSSSSASLDITRIIDYDQADMFFTAIGEPGFVLTTTVEFSPDGVNWAPILYEYWTGDRVGTTGANRVQSENGTIYQQVITAGTYLRVKLEAAGVVTPTVKAVYKYGRTIR